MGNGWHKLSLTLLWTRFIQNTKCTYVCILKYRNIEAIASIGFLHLLFLLSYHSILSSWTWFFITPLSSSYQDHKQFPSCQVQWLVLWFHSIWPLGSSYHRWTPLLSGNTLFLEFFFHLSCCYFWMSFAGLTSSPLDFKKLNDLGLVLSSLPFL